MILKPLGLKDNLLPPQTLGQKIQPLQSPSPLGYSLAPLGQNLQVAEFFIATGSAPTRTLPL